MDNAAPLVIIFGIAMVGLYLFIYVRDQRTKGALRERGVTASAHVTDRTHEVRSDTDDNGISTSTDIYYVSYAYTVQGLSYQKREKVSRDTYNALREGQSVEVVCLPENPGAARLASSL